MRLFVTSISPLILGILVPAFFFIVGFGLMYGFAELIKFVEPLLLALIALSILLFILGVLPCSIFKNLRSRMSLYALVLSAVCGGCVWLMSFMYVVLYLKWWVLLFIWLFYLSAPLAIALLVINNQYNPAIFLALSFVAAYCMRYYGAWLAHLTNIGSSSAGFTATRSPRADGDIFDAEVIDPEIKSIDDKSDQ